MLNADDFAWPLPPLERQRKPGRPRLYSDEIAEEICERIGNGERLHTICSDPRMPNVVTVYRWRAREAEFDKMYVCALLARFDLRSEELEKIAADGADDYKLDDKTDVPTVKAHPEALGRSKLRIDTLKWIMARELPFKYGESAPGQGAVPVPAAGAQPAVPAALPASNVIDLKSALDAVSMRGSAVAAK